MFAARNISPEDGWARRREHRHKVLIRTRMRAGGLPVDVCISNVSSRGLCAIAASPPPRGAFVELTDTAFPIVGQVVWSSSRRFGIAVQESIDLSRLVTHQQGAGDASAQAAIQQRGKKTSGGSQLSREEGQKMQFLVVAIAAAAATLLIGQLVYTQLSEAADAVAAGLR